MRRPDGVGRSGGWRWKKRGGWGVCRGERTSLRRLAALDDMAHAGTAPGEARELRLDTQVVGVRDGIGAACMELVLCVAVA